MVLIHLSDLHVGKRVNEISMIEDQEYIFKEILNIIRQEKADAVLICGDVYDRSIPPTEAVTLFDEFICRLAQQKIPVLVISGNHDSPERLAFGNRLLEQGGIHISPVYDGTVSCVTLQDDLGEVNFWLLPFLKPSHVRRFFPEESIESYTDACRVAVKSMNLDPTRRNVLLTHQFVTGAATCDSEDLSVGGTDNVDATVFEDFDYVALGHIHGPQNIKSNKIRYCGTPLKYSFSEEHHHKSVTVVKLGAKGELELSLCPLTPRRDLRSIKGSFDQVTDKSFYSGTATEDYLQVILTDEEDVPEAVGKLRLIYPNLMKLTYDNTRTKASGTLQSPTNIPQKSDLELFEEFYQQQNGQPMTPEQREFMTELIEAAKEDQP